MPAWKPKNRSQLSEASAVMDDVLTELRLLMETADSIGGTVRRSIEAQRRETAALSQRIDDLNSELIAQSNRIQALTTFVSGGGLTVADS